MKMGDCTYIAGSGRVSALYDPPKQCLTPQGIHVTTDVTGKDTCTLYLPCIVYRTVTYSYRDARRCAHHDIDRISYVESIIMKFVSTRSKSKLNFEEALFCCYTEDGGLLMPENIPRVTIETLREWKAFSYVEVAKRIVSMFVTEDEVSLQDQSDILDDAFKNFDSRHIVEITRLKDGLNVMELWHGDTLAFKDLAMTCTVRFLSYFLKKKQRHFTAVVVTSGDTGSSAMYAARDVQNIDVVVLYPHKRISRLQELMMTTVHADNMHLYAVDGSSDDIDVAATRVLTDHDFVRKHNVGTINSMNWSRIMVQIAHHVYGYLQTTREVGEPVDVITPCGGCGNITSCLLARTMGVPLRPIAVTNKNDSFARMIRTNERLLANVEVSLAPAMDISFAQNVERIFWLMSDMREDVIVEVMNEFTKNGKSTLPNNVYKNITDVIRTSVASDEMIIKAMRRCWKQNKYQICPHTATAVAYYYGIIDGGRKQNESGEIPTLCMATACASKFSEAAKRADIPVKISDKIEALQGMEERSEFIAKDQEWEEIIRKKIQQISLK